MNVIAKNKSFAKAYKSLKQIEAVDIEAYLEKTISHEKLQEQTYKNLKPILNGIFKFVCKHKYIIVNQMTNIEVSTTNLVVLPKKSKEAVAFTNKERDLLKNYISKYSSSHQPPLQVVV